MDVLIPAVCTYVLHCRGNKETLCEVFVPVVRTIIHAPPSSPLSTVDANNVVDFLVQLTSQKDAQGDTMVRVCVCT